MSLDEAIARILSAGALLGGIAALLGVVRSRRAGVKADEREARKVEAEQRRDTIADRDSLIDTLQEDIKEMRARLDRLEAAYNAERDYTRILQDHIYRHGEVPPSRVR